MSITNNDNDRVKASILKKLVASAKAENKKKNSPVDDLTEKEILDFIGNMVSKDGGYVDIYDITRLLMGSTTRLSDNILQAVCDIHIGAFLEVLLKYKKFYTPRELYSWCMKVSKQPTSDYGVEREWGYVTKLIEVNEALMVSWIETKPVTAWVMIPNISDSNILMIKRVVSANPWSISRFRQSVITTEIVDVCIDSAISDNSNSIDTSYELINSLNTIAATYSFTDEQLDKLINTSPIFISLYKNPSPELQMDVVKRDVSYFTHIRFGKASDEVIDYVIDNAHINSFFGMIHRQTQILGNNSFLERMTKKNGLVLKNIPKEYQTLDICINAVQNTKRAVQYIKIDMGD